MRTKQLEQRSYGQDKTTWQPLLRISSDLPFSPSTVYQPIDYMAENGPVAPSNITTEYYYNVTIESMLFDDSSDNEYSIETTESHYSSSSDHV